MVTQAVGNVIVAPNVLMNLVALGLREVPGIALNIYEHEVGVDCYLIAQSGTNLLELGMAAQATVAAVIRELAGMAVREVNIYIQDVEAASG